jgi:hypothetical protein
MQIALGTALGPFVAVLAAILIHRDPVDSLMDICIRNAIY